MAAYTLSDETGTDINGDDLPDLIVSAWSGGAHCCYSSGVYSVGEDVRTLLAVETGNCGPGEFEDLDGNGTREFITCDDRWAYTYCSFADSPFPRVVYSFDATRGAYVLDTPKYASRYRDQLAAALEDAQTWMSESGGKDLGLDKCRLLRPALGLMYGGRFDDGLVLLRGLYRARRSRAVRARHGRESPPEPAVGGALSNRSLRSNGSPRGDAGDRRSASVTVLRGVRHVRRPQPVSHE